MNINAIVEPRPELLLTKEGGNICWYGISEDTFFVTPGHLGIVTFRTGKILLWHRGLKDNVMLSSVCLN